ncbi:MAG: hypothetical protein MUC92_04635 [Fimbriimonadaceae bacterium]|nr:hypothetical protein [Fimbriimonadaceae bacterium]
MKNETHPEIEQSDWDEISPAELVRFAVREAVEDVISPLAERLARLEAQAGSAGLAERIAQDAGVPEAAEGLRSLLARFDDPTLAEVYDSVPAMKELLQTAAREVANGLRDKSPIPQAEKVSGEGQEAALPRGYDSMSKAFDSMAKDQGLNLNFRKIFRDSLNKS